ncbi:MAG: 4-aminobutyrate--2-oxoglutarate transaminase [Gammaproteobacteria bacterium]|nr:4-aminobutyrate--2-oxoglutarate transaminase [Gammaproteobacteria bacterium]MDH4255998.1 4-aminobutyrate--2-oxoglutarate transaminase [Gammaproteobacteria bacterium]MDH5310253.1 4-aminobutyrate--2-oxoglutarate transaminase [Gammaproteobacteria bacterium]
MGTAQSKSKAAAAPGNADWQARKLAAMARGQGNIAPVYIERAQNAELWDVEGKRYIDFATGIAVCNTGHSHPKIVAAVKEQVERFSHTCVMVTPYDSAVRLAENLNALVPGKTPKKTIFVTTGAEAVENSIKIARAHTGRRGVIAFNGAFHGRTLLAMGLTGKVTPYKNLFGPFPGEVYHVPFPIEYHGISVKDSIKALNNLFKADIAPTDVAAIIIEPVQGEGGFYVAPDELMRELRRLCDEHGIVLVSDEIQSGFGRTGKFFATEYSGIEPDLVTIAKGMAGGFPLAGVVGKAEIMDAPLPGGLGGTYGGSPVGCAAALAVLEVIEEEGLVARSNEIGKRFKARLQGMRKKYPGVIGEIRAERGAMMAIELVRDGDAEKPDADLTKNLVAAAYANGLALLSCGVYGNVIRFLPALTIPDALIDEGLDIVDACLGRLLAK